MNAPEINELMRLVEQKYGKSLHTSTDFEEFSLMIGMKGYGQISASTLKRLWAYVNDTRTPRMATLNILSGYVGHKSFDLFVEWLKQSTAYNSSFFSATHIAASDIEADTRIEIGWSPNRTVGLRYLGSSEFEVTYSENSKLAAGDRFFTGCFIKSQPLYLPYVLRNGVKTPAFIAGRNGGLSNIKIIKNDNGK